MENSDEGSYLFNLQQSCQFSRTTFRDLKDISRRIANRGREEWFENHPLTTLASCYCQTNKIFGSPETCNCIDKIKFLVRECGFNVNSTVRHRGFRGGPNGPDVISHWSPLAAAVISGNEATARFLVRELSADVNVKCNENKISRTALFEAVRTGKESMVRILVEELGVDINARMSLKDSLTSKPFLAIHYAMWMEMKKPGFEWPMTKLLLELGSDINFVSHWDSDFHPGYPVCKGTALDLAQEMKVRKFDSLFAAFKTPSPRFTVEEKGMPHSSDEESPKLCKQNAKEDLIKNLKSKMEQSERQFEISLAEKDSQIKELWQLIDGLRTAEGELKKSLSQLHFKESKRREKSQDFQTLICALVHDDLEQVKDIQRNFKANINFKVKNFNSNKVDGSILQLAVQSGQVEMLKMFVKDFKAKLHQEVSIEGRPSTLLILAMSCHVKKNQLELVSLLINLGADLNQSGWVKFQGVWLFGSPLDLAFYFQRESKKEIFLKMREILFHAQQISWNNMEENKMAEEMKTKLKWIKSQKDLMALKLEVLSTKVETGKHLFNKIKALKEHSGFMTRDEIVEEERILDLEDNLEKEVKVKAAKQKLEKNPDYLDDNQIKVLQSTVDSINALLSNNDLNTESVGIPGLECVRCCSLPRQVFSCCQDHLLCPDCLSEIDFCPICKQCFKLAIPRRNLLAERLITRMKSSSTDLRQAKEFPTELPAELSGDLSQINNHIEELRKQGQSLEKTLTKARQIEEEMLKFEVRDLRKLKSEERLETAKHLRTQIETLEQDPGFISEENIHHLSKSILDIKSQLGPQLTIE